MSCPPIEAGAISGNVGAAFGLVAGAGLSTTLGAALAFCFPYKPPVDGAASTNYFLAGSLAIAAGVMLYVSFIEIFAEKAISELSACFSDSNAYLYATLCFFAGVATIAIFDVALHAFQKWMVRTAEARGAAAIAGNDSDSASEKSTIDGGVAAAAAADENRMHIDHELGHDGEMVAAAVYNNGEEIVVDEEEAVGAEEATQAQKKHRSKEQRDLVRMGIFAGIAIAFHNFPEGLATFVAALEDTGVGAAVAIAIGIHNIPEGVCVAMPIYYATGSKWKAFFWATLSGLTELVGAALGWVVLRKVFNPLAYGILFGLVAGMMVYISLKELLPGAHRYDPNDKVTTICLVTGMVIMAASLVLFKFA